MANFTEGSNSTKIANRARLLLSSSMAVFFTTLNIALTITASLGNVLIFVALRSVSSILPSTKILFKKQQQIIPLASLPSQPCHIHYIGFCSEDEFKHSCEYFESTKCFYLNFILCGVSIITLVIISIDRLLALRFEIRYRHLAT